MKHDANFDHLSIVIVALATLYPKAAANEIKRQLAAAEWRGGVAACAALSARRAAAPRLSARVRAAAVDVAYQRFRSAISVSR